MQFNFALYSKDSNTFVFSQDNSLVAEKQVIYVGNFYQENEDEWFPVNESDIDNWVDVHNQFIEDGIEVPMPEEHNVLPSARRGEVLALSKKKDEKGRVSLYAKVKFKDQQSKEDFKDSQVSLYSPPKFTSGVGKTYPRPMTHLALTDYPVVPDLGDFQTIVASSVKIPKKEPEMSLKELALSLGVENTEESDDKTLSAAISKMFSMMNEEKATMIAKVDDMQKKLAEALKSAPADPTPIAAGILSMAKDSRKLKLERLVENGNISPAVSKKLEERFFTDATMTFSMNSSCGDGDGFNAVVDALSENKLVDLKGHTGPQILEFSNTNKDDTATDNELTRIAKAKQEA